MQRKRILTSAVSSCALLLALAAVAAPAAQFPRTVYLWGGYDPDLGPAFYAGYDIFIQYWDSTLTPQQQAQLRALNPDILLLLTSNLTYGSPWMEEWEAAAPGDPEWNYLMRNRLQEIIYVDFWDHPMFNLVNPACAAAVAARIEAQVATAQGTYDGLFFDRIHESISWLGSIDADLDGIVDNRDALDRAYRDAVRGLLDGLRQNHPGWVLTGNDARFEDFGQWIHGREYEYQMQLLLDTGMVRWYELLWDYDRWSRQSLAPASTWLASNPPRSFRDKYALNVRAKMPQAMKDEMRDAFDRMRFGLTSALLSDGLFCYEYGDTWHGNPWWYDEFDNAGAGTGYLGAPVTGAWQVASTPLHTPVPGDYVPPDAPFQGVMRRNFEHGIVLCNSTKDWRTVALEQAFTRIDGSQAPREKVIVDDTDLRCVKSPEWERIGAGWSEWGWNYHRTASGTGNARLVWTFAPVRDGTIEVSAWRAPAADRSTSVRYTVGASGGERTTYVNFASGSPQWMPLASVYAAAGQPVSVTVTNQSPGGWVIADAIKAESVARYNDGSAVDEVLLGPRDGAILLGTAPTWTPTFTPTPTRTPALGEVLNPSFEEDGLFGWQHTTTRGYVTPAEYGISPTSGQRMFGWSANWDGPWNDMVYQTVPVEAGKRYRFGGAAFAASVGGAFNNTGIRAHIDPSGGKAFSDATGGPWLSTALEWAGVSVEATAAGNWISVGFELVQRQPSQWNHAYVDDAFLEELAPGAPTATPYATRTPTPTKTATPTPMRPLLEAR